MKILFAGTPQNAANTMRFLVENGHEIVSVLTREDAPVGRKRILTESAVAALARTLDLPIIKSNSITPDVLAQIKDSGADLGVVVAFGTIFRPDALSALKFGWINLHYSLLPKYRGAAPVQWAILNGDAQAGVTVFQLDEGMDTGPIWGSALVSVEPRESYVSLLERLTNLGSSLLLEVLPRLYSQTEAPKPQFGEPSLAPKPNRNEAKLDFNQEAIALERKIRALNPEPATWCMWKGEPMQIVDATYLPSPLNADSSFRPGQVHSESVGVIVTCNDSSLILKRVKPAGKNEMNAVDWFRGISDAKDMWLS